MRLPPPPAFALPLPLSLPPSRAVRRAPAPPRHSRRVLLASAAVPSAMPRAATVGDGLMPKRETGVADFLARHPECDGDGVVVAVLDTGVDPGAPGLRVGKDGRAKVVDCVDCTGGGDVIMYEATVVKGGVGPAEGGGESGGGGDCVGAQGAERAEGVEGGNSGNSGHGEEASKEIGVGEEVLPGLSGRPLVLSPEIVAANPAHPDGYRVGLKLAYALLPKPLVARMKRERRVEFNRAQRAALSDAYRVTDAARAKADTAKGAVDKEKARLCVDEAEAAEAALAAAGKAEDYGPVYDCVTWFDGTRWRAVVDTSETGELSGCLLMEDYRLECRFSTLYDLCNYSVNIWDEGRTLSICVDSGSHGTHVAGMIAAYYPPGEQHMNGTAPGARIVSLKIGDTRLFSMETHQGLNRALAYMLAHSRAPGAKGTVANDGIVIDVANMSFGEPTEKPDHGRFVELATQLVREHNVPFFCSAGNNGPGLSSVSAPGGTTDALIGVGAYVTPGMLTEGYSMLSEDVGESFAEAEAAMAACAGTPDKPSKGASTRPNLSTTASSLPEHSGDSGSGSASSLQPVYGMPYTWTSRGPAADGGLGVSVCAPGGAIAAVPQWTLSRKRLMNGTSMASPCACSSLAVVLSYLKKRKIPYTSDLIRSAIENSARPLNLSQLSGSGASGGATGKAPSDVVYTEDLVFAGGCGSINVGSACDLIERVAAASKMRTAAAVAGDEASSRGVPELLRSPLEWRYLATVWMLVAGGAKGCVASSAGGGVLGGTRGVYLRGKAETRCVQRMNVDLEAVRDDEKLLPSSKAALASMETTITLEATEAWVTVPKAILLYGSGRTFPISVDPTGLADGNVHYAEIAGFVDIPGADNCHSPASSRYRVFRVPVTVAVPECPISGSSVVKPVENVEMAPGAVTRRFYAPPMGSTYGILRLCAASANVHSPTSRTDTASGGAQHGFGDGSSDVTSIASESTRHGGNGPGNEHQVAEKRVGDCKSALNDDDSSPPAMQVRSSADSMSVAMSSQTRVLDIHIVQVEPRQPTKHSDTRLVTALVPGATRELLFPLSSSATVEVAIGHRWNSMGISRIRSMEVVFCGLKPTPNALHMEPGASCFPRLDVTNLLPDGQAASRPNSNAHTISKFHPKASLENLRRAIAPTYSKISQLIGDRDRLPDSRQLSQLLLEYKFTVHDDNTWVSLSFPGINGHVYDGDVEGGPFVTLHDGNKKLMFCSDIYPAKRSLKKGTYYARATVRHDRTSVLEKLKDAQGLVTYRLLSSINLQQCFDTAQGASLRGDTNSKMRGASSKDWKGLVEPGEKRSLYFGALPKSSIPKWATSGDTLAGHFTVDEAVLVGSEGSMQTNSIPKYALSMPVPVSSSVGKGKPMVDVLAEKGDTRGVSAKEPTVSEIEDSKWLENTMTELRMKALGTYLKENKLVEFDRMCRSMSESPPSDSTFLLLKLQRLDATVCGGSGSSSDSTRKEAVAAVVSAGDELLALLNTVEVAAHFGLRNIEPEKTDATKEMERKRAMIIAALFRKARALYTLGHISDEDLDRAEKAYNELQRWQKLDGNSFLSDNENMMGEPASAACVRAEDFMLLAVVRHKLRRRHALALKALDAFLGSSHAEDVVPRRLADHRLQLLEELKWNHVTNAEKQGLSVRFPRGFEPL